MVRFDGAAVRAGLVDPREVLRFLKRGVEVWAVANLHAKVYVFGTTAFVGSANLSVTSEKSLVEAVCESDDERLVAECRRFVLGLRGDPVDIEFAESLIPLYRPPRFDVVGRRARVPLHAPLSIVMLETTALDEDDETAYSTSKKRAKADIDDQENFRLERFIWYGRLPKGMRKGSNLLCCTAYSKRDIRATPPARVIRIHPYRTARGRRWIVYLAVRKHYPERRLNSLLARVPEAAMIRKVKGFRQMTNRGIAQKIGAAWPALAPTKS